MKIVNFLSVFSFIVIGTLYTTALANNCIAISNRSPHSAFIHAEDYSHIFYNKNARRGVDEIAEISSMALEIFDCFETTNYKIGWYGSNGDKVSITIKKEDLNLYNHIFITIQENGSVTILQEINVQE
jgi:hypothetical protein